MLQPFFRDNTILMHTRTNILDTRIRWKCIIRQTSLKIKLVEIHNTLSGTPCLESHDMVSAGPCVLKIEALSSLLPRG